LNNLGFTAIYYQCQDGTWGANNEAILQANSTLPNDFGAIFVSYNGTPNVDIPKLVVSVGSVDVFQGDVINAKVHLGCTKEVSSWEILLQNWNGKYSPNGSYPVNVGQNGSIRIGRGTTIPQIITTRVETVEFESNPLESYVRLGGRCWGEKLFRQVISKKYVNQKGEAIVKDLIDNYSGLNHVRDSTELVEDTSTTFTLLEYANTPVWDILRAIAESSDNNGVIGYDFRVAPDARFEFFPSGSKISSVTLSERLEESQYSKGITGIRILGPKAQRRLQAFGVLAPAIV
jgi:hypothetical protein